MFRLALILVISFSCFLSHSFCQSFKVTFHVDFLNDGAKKSLLFSGNDGETLHAINLNSEGYEIDKVVEFDNIENSDVHLTIFKETFDAYKSPHESPGRVAYTYCHILNNSFFNYINEGPRRRLSREDWVSDAVEIHGVWDFEDITFSNRDYSIINRRIRKDTILRLRIKHDPTKDALIFLKVNEEDFYRQLYFSSEEAIPEALTINDLTPNIDVLTLELPYEGEWYANISTTNLENDNLYSLVSSNKKIETKDIIFPIPKDFELSDYRVTLFNYPEYPDREIVNNYSQYFEEAPKTVFHYKDFDFDVFRDNEGFDISIEDESDYYLANGTYFSIPEDFSSGTLGDEYHMNWSFIGHVNEKKNIRISYPDIPFSIKKHIAGHWESKDFRIGHISMIKGVYKPNSQDWIRPVDFWYFLRDNGYHQLQRKIQE